MRIRLLLLPLAVVALLAGCSGDPEPTEPEPTTAPTPAIEGFSIERLVAHLPALEGQTVVSVGDVEAATELAGLERPAEPGAGLADWVSATSGITSGAVASLPWPEPLGILQLGAHEEFVAAVGFGIPQIDAFVAAAAPPSSFTLVDGRFDPAAITAALGEPEDGIWAQPGEELAPVLDGPRIPDLLGRPVVVAGDASHLVLTLERRLAAAWLDGEAGASAALVEAARALDEEGAYAAQFRIDGDAVVAVGLVADGGASRPVALRAGTDGGPATGDVFDVFTVTDTETRGAHTIVRLAWPADTPPAVAWRLLATRNELLG